MPSAFATVFIVRHVEGKDEDIHYVSPRHSLQRGPCGSGVNNPVRVQGFTPGLGIATLRGRG